MEKSTLALEGQAVVRWNESQQARSSFVTLSLGPRCAGRRNEVEEDGVTNKESCSSREAAVRQGQTVIAQL